MGSIEFCEHFLERCSKDLAGHIFSKVGFKIQCIFIAFFRDSNYKIQVNNLHEKGEGQVPNPIVTFEEAFKHYRKYIDFYYSTSVTTEVES